MSKRKKAVEQEGRLLEGNADLENFTDVIGAVNYLKNRCSDEVTARVRGNPSLKRAVGVTEKVAGEVGISPEHIEMLVDVIGCSKLPKTMNHKLIKSLIPCTVVPRVAVIKTISWMSTSLLPPDTKALLLRWMLVVFNHIDDKEILHQLYNLLFLFIENTIMRPHLCHLLYLVTRKEDVRLFRIRALLQIHQTSVTQSYVLGLLSVYKLYCPHLVAISIAKTRKVFFRQTDAVWSAKVRKVLNTNGPTGSLSDNPADLLPKPADFYVAPQSKKKKPDEIALPSVQNTRSPLANGRKLVPFSQIKSFEQLLKNVDRFELPSQVGAVLMDLNFQHILSCLPDPVLPLRIGYWLNHMLFEEFMNTYASNELRQKYLLRLLVELSEFLQEGLPVCDNFLSTYLCIWNGTVHRSLVFKLISRCRLYQFAELNEMILEPLRQLFFASSVYFKGQMIICFTELLQNFAQVEYRRYKYTINLQKQRASSSDYLPDICSVFSLEVEEFSALRTIQDFIRFVDAVCVIGLQQENSNLMLIHCILGFFEQVAGLYTTYGVPLFCVPSYGIWYTCLFHQSAMVIARLCAIVCKYREAYSALRSSSQHLTEDEQINRKLSLHQSIGIINAYMTDMCDMLWRNRAFKANSSVETIFRLVSADVLNQLEIQRPNSRFSIYLNRAFLGFSNKFLKSNPSSNNQVVNPAAIKQCKDIYLEFLDQENVHGISEFVKTCIKRSTSQATSAGEGHSVDAGHLSRHADD